MKPPFLATLLFSFLSACGSEAQNTTPVDAVIAGCIQSGQSHQVCACRAHNLRSEIGEKNYTELLRVTARVSELEAQGRDEIVTAPNAGQSEYQMLLGTQGVLMGMHSIPDLANRASDDLCTAQISPIE